MLVRLLNKILFKKIGQEGAGTVVSTGSHVNRFKPGQKVAFMTPGSLSEYHVIDQAKVVAIPDNLTEIDAAVGMLQGLTAWTFLQEACQIKKGTAVLIYAASGGVGTLLVQMAKHLGAYVIGTVSNEQKAQLAKDNGADDIIYYTNNSIVDKVLELTNGKGVDVIFDGVGRDTFEDDFTIVARKGTIISFGNASGAVPPFSILRLTEKNVKLLRPSVMNYVSTAEEFEHYSSQLFDLISRGIVKLHVHDVYKFDIESLRQAQADIT